MATDKMSLGTSALMVTSLPRVTKKIKSVLEKARIDFRSQDIYQFIDRDNQQGISQLYSLMPVYAECLDNAQVDTRGNLERAWTRCTDHAHVKRSVDNLLEAEEEFEDFVDEVERELRKKESPYAVKSSALAGHKLPKGLALITASTGKPLTLEACWKDSKYTLFVLIRHFG